MLNSSAENRMLTSLGFRCKKCILGSLEPVEFPANVIFTFLSAASVTLPSFQVMFSLPYPESFSVNSTISSTQGFLVFTLHLDGLTVRL